MVHIRRLVAVAAVAAVLALVSALISLAGAAPARADGPGSGTPTLVTLGDSYISGEAGRWAGNTNTSSSRIDALGPTAYFDNAGHTAEQIPRCHRSASAPVHLGGGVDGIDLACSGASTTTDPRDVFGYFKPGLDFYDAGPGRQGQARMLADVAASHHVTAVVVSIGGNDIGFAEIVAQCLADFLASPSWWPDYCHDDSRITRATSASALAAARANVATALTNVRTAMRSAGYADGSWTLIVMTYPRPLATSAGYRYRESGYTRQSIGGCGFWNADADWASTTLNPAINATLVGGAADSGVSPRVVVDMSDALAGRRLCEKSVGLLEERGLSSWTQLGAVDQTEWVSMIRTISTAVGDYYVQESLHPNYWGQLAQRSCLRQAYNGGSPRGGTCTIAGTGLAGGEPRMILH
jgi:hypothetical protein